MKQLVVQNKSVLDNEEKLKKLIQASDKDAFYNNEDDTNIVIIMTSSSGTVSYSLTA